MDPFSLLFPLATIKGSDVTFFSLPFVSEFSHLLLMHTLSIKAYYTACTRNMWEVSAQCIHPQPRCSSVGPWLCVQWRDFYVDHQRFARNWRSSSRQHTVMAPQLHPCHPPPLSCLLQCGLAWSFDSRGLPLLYTILSFFQLSSSLSPFLLPRSCSSCFFATMLPLH